MRSFPRLPLAVLAPLAILLAAACAATFTPASVVEDLRVLAIVADPPELRLSPAAGGNTVTLHAVAVAPPAAPGGPPRTPAAADVTWSFCPYSIGAAAGYACAIPACESTLPAAADGSVTVDPLAELMKPACVDALAGLGTGGGGGPGSGGSIETLVRYVATLDGLRREAVQRIPVWFGTPPATAPNLNPVIVDPVTLGEDCSGQAAPCSVASVSLDVTIDASSFQPYPVGVDRTVEETIVISFFTTAGRFKYDYGQATSASPGTGTLLEAKELGGATQALVWVVARDLRGGEAVKGPYAVVFSK